MLYAFENNNIENAIEIAEIWSNVRVVLDICPELETLLCLRDPPKKPKRRLSTSVNQSKKIKRRRISEFVPQNKPNESAEEPNEQLVEAVPPVNEEGCLNQSFNFTDQADSSTKSNEPAEEPNGQLEEAVPHEEASSNQSFDFTNQANSSKKSIERAEEPNNQSIETVPPVVNEEGMNQSFDYTDAEEPNGQLEGAVPHGEASFNQSFDFAEQSDPSPNESFEELVYDSSDSSEQNEEPNENAEDKSADNERENLAASISLGLEKLSETLSRRPTNESRTNGKPHNIIILLLV